MAPINKHSLLAALGSRCGTPIGDVRYSTEVLQGGTVGDVVKIQGEAQTTGGSLPFTMVLKTQGQWERYGDPGSWRREYDIYKQGLAGQLPRAVRLPACYRLEEEEGTTRIWMEFVQGKTGWRQLQAGELALAAGRLGELQAEFHLTGRRDLAYLRAFPAVESSFELWWGRMEPHLRSPIDGFPDDLRCILNSYAARSQMLLEGFRQFPFTLCQGDVHHDNLILTETEAGTEVCLLDWDTAGYGYMGEDAVDLLAEAFVYSDRDIALLPLFRQHIINAYCQGARKQKVAFSMDSSLVRDIFALAWGFRIADLYLYYREELPKQRCVAILRAMLAQA